MTDMAWIKNAYFNIIFSVGDLHGFPIHTWNYFAKNMAKINPIIKLIDISYATKTYSDSE